MKKFSEYIVESKNKMEPILVAIHKELSKYPQGSAASDLHDLGWDNNNKPYSKSKEELQADLEDADISKEDIVSIVKKYKLK